MPGEMLSDADVESDTIAATSVGTLLSTALANSDRQPTKEAIARSLETCIQLFFEGNASILSRKAHISKQTITNWRAGIPPRLDALLRVCFHSKVSPLSFLLETIPTVNTANTSTESNKSNVSSNKKRPPGRKLDLKQTEEVLKNALTQNPPLCLAHVAKRMGRIASTIRYHFPDLCKAVADRHAEYEQRCVLSRIDVKRKALQAALADNTHPSTVDVARQLGVQPQNLIKELPDLCKEVSRRHIEGRNNRWFKIGSELNAMLGEWPPPSMREICKRIGYCVTSLHRHHSHLCHRLAARHVKFRHYKLRRRTPSV